MTLTESRSSLAPRPAHAPTGLPRLVATVREDGRPASLADHTRHHGPLPTAHAADLLAAVEASGLSGRGGASFPAAEKLKAVARRRGAIVVANGAEGEPMSGKDRALLRAVPHLVLDGAILAARIVGSDEAIVTVGAAARLEQQALKQAVDERARARTDPRVRIRIAVVPDAFVAGEETALVQFLNGGPAKPTFVPPRPFERGVRGAPTLVQNVETLAHLALIARFGARWFRELGTPAEPGSTLVTVRGAIARPGVREIPIGLPFSALLEEAGGVTEPVAAFLIGGYFGSWIPASSAHNLRLADAELAEAGARLGARSMVALPAATCAVAEVARVARYLADESAGQCGPCVNGLHAISDAFARLVTGDVDVRKRVERWLAEVYGRGGCRHPDGTSMFLTSALTTFRHEIDLHLRYGRCANGDRGILQTRRSERRR